MGTGYAYAHICYVLECILQGNFDDGRCLLASCFGTALSTSAYEGTYVHCVRTYVHSSVCMYVCTVHNV